MESGATVTSSNLEMARKEGTQALSAEEKKVVGMDADGDIDDQVAALEAASVDVSGADWEVYYEDGGGYFVNVDSSKTSYYKRSEPQMRRALKRRRFHPKARPEKGEVMSEIDQFLERIEMESRVFYAGPLSGYKAGPVRIQGENALITRTHQFLKGKMPSERQREEHPECPGFPLYYGITKRMFDNQDEKVEQLHYWWGWLQYSLECLHSYRTFPGLALAIAGDTSCGKTLQTDLLQHIFGGKSAKPYDWMIGRDTFNPEIAQSPLLLIDDEAADGSFKARNNLKAQVKKFVANSSIRIRGMHTPAINVSFFARLVFLLNLEESNLIVLPPIDADLDDKMMMLKAYKHPMPMPTRRITERQKFWDALVEEMPYLVHWLLYEYELPEEYWSTERYFVKPYKHPEIMGMLHSLSRSSQVWLLIEKVIWRTTHRLETAKNGTIELPSGCWIGRTSDLLAILNDDESPLTKQERDLLPKGSFLSRDLTELEKHHGSKRVRNLGHNRSGSAKLWMICKEDVFDTFFGPDSDATVKNSVRMEVAIDE